jgi:hypothetical protein
MANQSVNFATASSKSDSPELSTIICQHSALSRRPNGCHSSGCHFFVLTSPLPHPSSRRLGSATALLAVLAEWKSADDYTTRTTNLRNGINGVQLTAGVTVFNDTSADPFTGGNNQDWIFKALDDVFADPELGELVESL